jgi:hypothetical protein
VVIRKTPDGDIRGFLFASFEFAERFTPLCPAGHLPLKGEIDPRRGHGNLDI